MSIYLDKNSKVIVQGITGREGLFHTGRMLAYGTNIVGGVTPGKGGTKIDSGQPVFNTVKDAVDATGATHSIIFVPPFAGADALYEAYDAGIAFAVCITEGIPVHEMLKVVATTSGMRIIGPNCPGIITPGKSLVGIMPSQVFKPGNIGMISRSGTLTYEIVDGLTRAGLGQSTCVGIGGDTIIGTTFVDRLREFANDPETHAVVVAGEIGGAAEEAAAAFIQDAHAGQAGRRVHRRTLGAQGRASRPRRACDHSSGNTGTPESKVKALSKDDRRAGCRPSLGYPEAGRRAPDDRARIKRRRALRLSVREECEEGGLARHHARRAEPGCCNRRHVVREVLLKHVSGGLDTWIMDGMEFLDRHDGHSVVIVSPAVTPRRTSLFAYFVSFLTGDAASQVQFVAVAWSVYGIHHRAFDLGLVGLVLFAPTLLLMLYTGHVADRYDRKRLVIVMGVAEGALSLVFGGLVYAHVQQLALLLAVVLLLGDRARLRRAARGHGILINIVDPETFLSVNARYASLRELVVIGSPVLGGLLVAISPVVALAVAGGMTFVAVVVFAFVQLRRASDRARRRGLLARFGAGGIALRRLATWSC